MRGTYEAKEDVQVFEFVKQEVGGYRHGVYPKR